jgi:hypothetical protein
MTARDRIVIVGLAALALLAATWLLAVSPKREQAAKLATEVTAAQAQLATAESQVSSATAAQAQYQTAYASIVHLGKAVPAGQEVPSLIYQLAQATNEKNVEFASITATVPGTSTDAGAGASSTASASATPGAAAASAGAGFTQMPFTFVFNGSFNSLYSLFQQLDGFTLRTTSGGLNVSGRLLTIQSVKLAPVSGSGPGGSAPGPGTSGPERLSGTIAATAYVLPAGQTLTGEATPAGPTGTATHTASTRAAGSATAPAVVQVNQ